MTPSSKKPVSSLHIAAIGASAGGFDALEKLFCNLPADISNIAFIIVQHLSPNNKSMLVQSLSSHTKLKVAEIKNTTTVKNRTIYIKSPDYEIAIKKGKLYLSKALSKKAHRPSIDALFNSLAIDQKENAIGIILSGTGKDGAKGIKAIKKAGGAVLVQEPETARYNGMALAAIETGLIDQILPPEKIGQQLIRITSGEKNKIKPIQNNQGELKRIKELEQKLKSANEKIEQQTEMLRIAGANVTAMLGNNMQAIILTDKNCKIIAFNIISTDILKKICGSTISVGNNLMDQLLKCKADSLVTAFKTAIKGTETTGNYEFPLKNGKSKTYLFNFSPALDLNKETVSVSFSLLDVTELQKTKTELTKSGILIDAVFHTADIGFAVLDEKAHFVKVNDGLCKLLGYTPNELIQKPFLQIIPGSEKKEALAQHKQFLTGSVNNIERTLLSKVGNTLNCFLTINLFVDNDGNKFIIKTIRDISESKKFKDLLQAAESAVHMGGYEYDLPADRMIWTKEMYNIFEVPESFGPTIEKTIKLFPKESRGQISSLYAESFRTGKNFDTELILDPRVKPEKWVRVTGTVKKSKSKISKLIGTVQDITSRKRDEYQLKQLSLVASKTNNAVVITDAAGKTDWVNDSFTKITGYTFDELIGKTPGEMLQGPETDKSAIERISNALKKKLPITEVIRNYRKDGTPIWLNMDIAPVIQDGKLFGFIGIGIDITELIEAKEVQKTKETLERQQSLFSSIAKNFPDGIIGVLDKNFRYIFAGGTEIKKLGLTPEHLIGEHIFDSLSRKLNRHSETFFRRALEGQNVVFEETLQGSDYLINAVPLSYKESSPEQILVVLYNITKRKKAESELWQALTRQKELNDLKSKFVAIASHEFRTPLSGILSSAYLISKYSALNEDEKIQKHIEKITSSVHSLTDILNDFLSIGKIEDGKMKNHPEEFDIVEFCENLTDEIRLSAKHGQTIIYQQTGDTRKFLLDKQHLKHVLTNLLSNAIKYSGEGKNIWLSSNCAEGNLQFVVKDEGIGIPQEDQSHLFETFFRANNVSNLQGTGMGLHIVKKYLEIMGGSIQFSSKTDQGSTFTIQFPARATAVI
ncbi:chemotaxis protein CheB [Flavihumibacter profundi]|uniref:chemotaxis protein CheB n=1 Tax=Flavihumibacter profundi TaxID=2716883 RepID=UPI001CC5F2E4|nr:chemotaxis protein CheB [Flavihumibacter profundi]MBZ5856558.1 PAS domain S-box protein [Flavihumibacter profundi]